MFLSTFSCWNNIASLRTFHQIQLPHAESTERRNQRTTKRITTIAARRSCASHTQARKTQKSSKQAKHSETWQRKRLKIQLEKYFFLIIGVSRVLTSATQSLVILLTLATNKAAIVSIKLPMQCSKSSTKTIPMFWF